VSVFLYAFGAIVSILFEGRLMEVLKMKKMKEKITKLKDHVILCGVGDVGSVVLDHVSPVVFVEQDEAHWMKLTHDGVLGVKGDSTKPEFLYEAGIEHARALIVALDSDPDTVFTILTAKELNPNIMVYARANHRDSVGKIKWAGADHVVCLTEIAGRELSKAFELDNA